MAHKDEVTADRRSFLKMASVGTLASGAAAITGGAAQATEEVCLLYTSPSPRDRG